MATGDSATTYLANALLDHIFGGDAYSQPTELWCHLYTVTPTDAGGGTEVTGGSYVEQEVTSLFPGPADDNSIANDTEVDFGTATADWGTIVALGLKDEGANLLLYGPLKIDGQVVTRTISSGDGFSIPVGDLIASLT